MFGDNNVVLQINNGVIVNGNSTFGATKDWLFIGRLSTPFIYHNSNNSYNGSVTIGNITLSTLGNDSITDMIISPLPNDGNVGTAIVSVITGSTTNRYIHHHPSIHPILNIDLHYLSECPNRYN
jgi:hypothetical protein